MRPITRRTFLRGAAAVTAAMTTSRAAGQPAPGGRPNILFILADDLGYGDLSCYGRPDYQTPVLDSLARQGIKFTSAYAAAPVCTPTRCAFVTGRYPQRLDVGLREPLTARDRADRGLQADHPTIGSLLKANGYDTALVGKWHLGWKPEFGPNRHGFDEFYGILSGAADYFTHQSADSSGSDLWENLTPVQHTGYLTDLFSDRAVKFLSRPRTKPFYLSLHYTAPHSPWEGPEHQAMAHTTHGQGPMVAGGSLKIYASMMKSLDDGIGRVLQALQRARLERNTLVIFTSDNGGERYSFNWPFSSEKLNLWEGGIRVPAIVRWPGIVPAGRTTEQSAITMDWTATILAATNTQPAASHPLDGEDLMPVCRGARTPYERPLFWRTQAQDAARVGKWKYLKESDREHLFDLSIDPGEKNDLRTERADIVDRMKNQHFAWNAQMLARL
ncbi:MAG TPA: sulfatase-like hydrolase/transferase [Vicinamibacterales bacterium]